jgi:hypothetical protein
MATHDLGFAAAAGARRVEIEDGHGIEVAAA